jgi:hypothetical protein
MAALFVLGAAVGSAQSIRVLVDGQLLATSAPPREVGGRIMVGMRDIFERLGAEVKWDAAERRITAMRGPRTVVLWIGRNVAYVDEATIGLDVPPMLLGGYTYVPVRFPSEALGANVGWLAATRTVLIDTSTMPPLDGGPPPGPGPGPITPPVTGVQGSFLQLVAATPRVLLVKNYATDNAETYILASNAVFQRGEASAAVLPVVQPEALLKGDDLKLALNAVGQVERVEARFLLSQITFQAAAANSLLADTGQVYHLAADVVITREGVGPITLAGLGAGEKLMVRQNPASQSVWEITAPPGTPPPPPQTGPQIFMIGAEGYTRPLKQGETLTVKLQGTPGGAATFDIGTAVSNLKLTENPAGIYAGSYRVKRADEIVDAHLVGHLTAGGKDAPLAQSEDPVSLDAVAPTVDEYVPARDAVLNTNRPVIQVTFHDGNGVGVDLQSLTLHIGGADVTDDCMIGEEILTYYSPEMPDGTHRAHFRGADLAGNELTELHWDFTIDTKTAPSAITAVSHAPAGVTLAKGDELTVTLFAQARGKSASFDIVGLKDGIAMTRQGGQNSKEWRGTYVVKAGDNVADAVVRGRFVDKDNAAHQLDDPQRIAINTRTQADLVIAAPTNGATVDEVFTLSGTAAIRRNVSYEVTYEGRSRLLGARVTGAVQQGQVKSDAAGNWTVQIDTRAVRDNVLLKSIDQFIVKCTMAGAAGQPARTKQIAVKP